MRHIKYNLYDYLCMYNSESPNQLTDSRVTIYHASH